MKYCRRLKRIIAYILLAVLLCDPFVSLAAQDTYDDGIVLEEVSVKAGDGIGADYSDDYLTEEMIVEDDGSEGVTGDYSDGSQDEEESAFDIREVIRQYTPHIDYGLDREYTDPDDAADAINVLLNDKDVLAVLFLCDSYPLRNAASPDAQNLVDIPSGTTLVLKGVLYNGSDYWFYVDAFTSYGELYGYIPKSRFICVDEDFLTWEQHADDVLAIADTGVTPLRSDQTSEISNKALESVYFFPDSYREDLLAILKKHPEWVFVPQRIGSTLDDVVSAQLSNPDRNLIYKTVDERFRAGKVDSNWYRVNRLGLTYIMNPANFLGSEKNLFMFEHLTYNESYHTAEGVQSVLASTFMKGEIPGEDISYAEAFYLIGRSLKVSPYHLASRVIQEQGSAGTSSLISGTYKGYEGYYNYFNINASGKNNTAVIKNGLAYAVEQGWDSRYKSLAGGASFDSKNYILAGQDTLYLQKFNLVNKNYSHQYMQNATAPHTESGKVYAMYQKTGALDNAFVFKIPVFDGEKTSPAPSLKPEVDITLSKKPDIFYSSECEESLVRYRITASESVKRIALQKEFKESCIEKKQPYFDVAGFDKDTGILTLKPVGVNASNMTKIAKKIPVDITFKEYGDLSYTLTIPVSASKPKIKAKAAALYGTVNKTVIFLDSDELPEDISVSVNDANMELSYNSVTNDIEVSVADGFKSGTKKLTFESANWNAPVVVSVAVKRVKPPAMKLSSTKVKLNSSLNYYANGPVTVAAHVSGSITDVTIDGIEPSNDAAARLLDNGYLISETDGNKIALGLMPDNRGDIRAGTYAYIVSGHMKDDFGNEIGLRAVKLSVTVVDKDPASLVKFTSKGTVSISRPDDTYMIYTPRITDLGTASAITEAHVTGEYEDEFEVTSYGRGDVLANGTEIKTKSGALVLKIKDAEAVSFSTRYRVNVSITLDNGLTLEKTVNVKPVR